MFYLFDFTFLCWLDCECTKPLSSNRSFSAGAFYITSYDKIVDQFYGN